MAFKRCLTSSALGAWTWAVFSFFFDAFFLDVAVEFLFAARRGIAPVTEVDGVWRKSELSLSLSPESSSSDVGWVFAENKMYVC